MEELRERSAAFIVAAAAKDMEEDRGEGVPWGGANALGWIGEVDMEREGGREFKSGDMVKERLGSDVGEAHIRIRMTVHSQEDQGTRSGLRQLPRDSTGVAADLRVGRNSATKSYTRSGKTGPGCWKLLALQSPCELQSRKQG